MVERIRRIFLEEYHTEPLLVRSPGRVNIIGEHTDYNEGFVLPAAIDKAIYVGVSARQDAEIHLYSEAYQERYMIRLPDLAPQERQWTNYVLGVVDQLKQKGYPLRGFNLVLGGDVPLGAGLSSSAAVECAVIFALDHLFDFTIAKLDLVRMAQKAEQEYTGVMCGVMDMFASMFGKKGYAIKLDCRSLEYEYVPLNMAGIKILLLNTNVKHSLASTAYNERRQQCEQGLRWVQELYPEAKSLRDVSLDMLDQQVLARDPLIYKRCRYVLEENQRLLTACEDLKNGDLAALGQQMFRAHEGVSREYEVSCPELDFLVDYVRDTPGVLGARMMGGGFGGCTINFVEEASIAPLLESIAPAYQQATGLELTAHIIETEDGTSVVSRTIVPGNLEI